jgi:hypothetical protein
MECWNNGMMRKEREEEDLTADARRLTQTTDFGSRQSGGTPYPLHSGRYGDRPQPAGMEGRTKREGISGVVYRIKGEYNCPFLDC